MARQVAYLGLLILMLVYFTPSAGASAASEKKPDVTAQSAIVIEASTGKVLYAKNADQRRYPASTTKIMTLITALEHSQLDELVTTSENAAATEGSCLWLAPGERLKMLDMLYGIMLISGNDATVAVAEHISGSVDKFAKLMTEKAKAIGASNTHFTNSSGLPDKEHYSTARDLARITAYGYRNPIFTQIVSTRNIVIPWPGKNHDRDLYNENKMLWLYEGANGVKTGYTEAAGRCLVSAAKRDNIQLISVVLDSERMWDDSIALLDYGFTQLKLVTLIQQGDIMKTVKINDGKAESIRLVANADIMIPMAENEQNQFSTVINVPNKINAPINKGQKIGVAKVMYNNAEVSSVDLVADYGVEKRTFFGLLWGSVWNLLTYVIRNLA
ncbi:MAG TPA: D-alanyl-D-alanine carboxypeptidase family protein [Methylomusa anaerophila]|uniref:serine-type D-Ala-D-Ala carboxypeptidase n=1 Tax=Methylomusa anaerophila TaxID=1930071 RepID=A0A348APG2_9FIRM|nr:D-alanyl-D-alanine carboxypeptidase family protein [Methylomusa anaerophila]BBB92960.1 D-alanyl-D-alanine carboxypeptidase DacB precursor [Methylomusa anaerophila]HML87206.1 D-alanyl-D-alanine carboxypeptidase family protein [Methylomusa anaerophila]